MLIQLILKDFRAHSRTIFILVLLLWMLGGSMMMHLDPQWQMYSLHASMTIACASTLYIFKEKNRQTEILTGSLPVSRRQIVLGRYAASGLILMAGMGLWLLIAYVSSLILEGNPSFFNMIFHPGPLIVPPFFQALTMSLFLPAAFRFGLTGSIILFTGFGLFGIAITKIGLRPYAGSVFYQWQQGVTCPLVWVGLIILVLPILSILLSIRLYSKRDI